MTADSAFLIVKTGSTHPPIRERLGDFEDWIAAGLRAGGCQDIRVFDARGADAPPDPALFAGAVITGSHAMVSDREPWSEALVPWVKNAVDQQTPLLGICYGHQLLAHALGGEVTNHPKGVEIGTVSVERHAASDSDPLMVGLPKQFEAQATHWQSVRRLPPGAVLLAGNAFEAHHAFRVGPCAWGVQFHPEFSAEALGAYLERLVEPLAKVGLDASEIRDGLRNTPEAASVLPSFARWALTRNQRTASQTP